jgi:hypothetical protein
MWRVRLFAPFGAEEGGEFASDGEEGGVVVNGGPRSRSLR